MVVGTGCPFAETVQVVDQYCNLFHRPADGAFGEALVSQLSPAFQIDGLYGLNSSDFKLNNSNDGLNYVSNDGLMTIETGSSVGSFSTLRSNRSIRYRPGQGALCRMTAMFPNGFTAGYQQIAGFLNQSDIIGVGYNFGNPSDPIDKREQFAILRRQNSKGQVAQFTITTPASGSETVTVTLNDVPYTVTVDNSPPSTDGPAYVISEYNAAQIATGNDYSGWIVDYFGNDVFFLFDGPPVTLSGNFTLTSDGTLAASNDVIQYGTSPSDNWTYQSDFNIDTLDGNGPSKMIIDPTKLNVFAIDFRWLGAGRIRYSIEDPATGCIFPFHMDYYANQNTVPHISNPSMRIGYGAANAAPAIGTGENVIVQGASIMGAVEGSVVRNGVTRSINEADEYNPNLPANTDLCFLSLKNNRIATVGKPNVLNQRELIINSISVAIKDNGASGDPIRIRLYKNAQTENILTYRLVDTLMSFSNILTEMSPNQDDKLIGSYIISSQADLTIDLTPLRIILTPLETLCVSLESVNTIESQGIAINFEVE